MAPIAPVTHILSTASGVLMVAAIAVESRGPALGVATLALAAVAVAMMLRPAATAAVLFTVTAIALSNPSPVLAALSGLSAAAYVVLRYAVGTHASIVTVPTMVAAVGFTFVGLVATSFPLQLPWLPLLAPLVVFVIYLSATRPFWG